MAAPITDPELLKEAVRKQVEFYFSKDNLQTDAYLVKLMDENLSVPISAIMKVIFHFIHCIINIFILLG